LDLHSFPTRRSSDLDGHFVGDVDGQSCEAGGVSGLRVLQRCPFLLAAIGDDHVRAFGQERRSYGATQAAGSARDENGMAFESCAHKHTSPGLASRKFGEGTSFSALLEELCDQAGPAGLMAGAKTGAVVAV